MQQHARALQAAVAGTPTERHRAAEHHKAPQASTLAGQHCKTTGVVSRSPVHVPYSYWLPEPSMLPFFPLLNWPTLVSIRASHDL